MKNLYYYFPLYKQVMLTGVLLCLVTGLSYASYPAPSARDADAHAMTLSNYLLAVIGQPDEVRRSIAQGTLEYVNKRLQEPDAESNPELYKLRVAAMGTIARMLSTGESIRKRYGSRSLDAIRDMREIVAEDDANALALHGIWHLEVRRRGGAVGAVMLGASREDGRALLDSAMQEARSDYMIPFAYAIVLLSDDIDSNREEAVQLLKRSNQLADNARNDALANAVKLQGGMLLNDLDAGHDDAVIARASGIM